MLTRVKLFTAAAAAIITLIAAPVTTMTAQPQDAAAKFATLSDEFMKASLVLSPSGASQEGGWPEATPCLLGPLEAAGLFPTGASTRATRSRSWRQSL